MIEWFKRATDRTAIVGGTYKFHIHSEPEYVDTASTINVTAFADKTERTAVPCSYRWFRVRNGLKEEVIRYKGSSYICDPSDIGAIIQVEVTSNDQQMSGHALL